MQIILNTGLNHMGWLRFLGVKSRAAGELDSLQCIRHLKTCDSLDSDEAIEIIERLEWVTGHPDIMTYLQDNPWRSRAPKIINNDIAAEVCLLNQLIDFQSPDEDSFAG